MDDDADARPERHLPTTDLDNAREVLEEALRDAYRESFGRLVEQERELVAAEASQRVCGPDRLRETRRNHLQQLVAGAVTERVVDLLEAVEVDEENRETISGTRGARERLLEPVAEERTVGEPGEAVVERLPRQLLLEPDALGDVTGVQHDAADEPVCAQVGHVRLELPPLAEPIPQPELDLVRLSACARFLEELAIVRVHERGEPRAVDLGLRAPECLDDGLADVAAATGPEDDDEVGRRRDQAPEVSGLASGRSDERPAEQQRDQQAGGAEDDLQRDQIADVPVVRRPDRARGVERHVRGERSEDAEPLHRAEPIQSLVSGEGDRCDRPPPEDRRSGRGQVPNEPRLLCQLGTDDPAAGRGERRLVVVSCDPEHPATVQEGFGTPRHDHGGRVRVGLSSAAQQEDTIHIALCQRPLAGGDLDHRRSVA